MKKLLLVIVLGLSLMSCKKDKDSVENVQPKTAHNVSFKVENTLSYSATKNGSPIDINGTYIYYTGDIINLNITAQYYIYSTNTNFAAKIYIFNIILFEIH